DTMRRVVRQSKFRHVFGQAVKNDQCYDDIRVSRVTWDSSFCAVNPRFVAIIVDASGGGAFLVLPLHKTGRIDKSYPTVCGHTGPVLDIDWCPHNDQVIASGSEDCTVMVWQIPENGLTLSLTEPVVVLEGHSKRVGIVAWHPTARNVLLSADAQGAEGLWEGHFSLYVVQSRTATIPGGFRVEGTTWIVSRWLLSVSRDIIHHTSHPTDTNSVSHISLDLTSLGAHWLRSVNNLDPPSMNRSFSSLYEHPWHSYFQKNMEEPIALHEMDTSNGVLLPFYDPDTNIIYLCGK
ncbi:COR1C protein, partial [Ptilorrhoa leucosticta]|nr:COR1C protein [Ptilorrhoa leucosticta]